MLLWVELTLNAALLCHRQLALPTPLVDMVFSSWQLCPRAGYCVLQMVLCNVLHRSAQFEPKKTKFKLTKTKKMAFNGRIWRFLRRSRDAKLSEWQKNF